MNLDRLQTEPCSKTDIRLRSGGASAKLLLVESNSDEQLLTELFFRRHGVLNQMVIKATGDDALAYLRNGEAQLRNTLVLVDSRLAAMEAIDFVTLLLEDERTKDVPIIAICGLEYDREMISRIFHERIACVSQPLNWSELMQAVKGMGVCVEFLFPATTSIHN